MALTDWRTLRSAGCRRSYLDFTDISSASVLGDAAVGINNGLITPIPPGRSKAIISWNWATLAEVGTGATGAVGSPGIKIADRNTLTNQVIGIGDKVTLFRPSDINTFADYTTGYILDRVDPTLSDADFTTNSRLHFTANITGGAGTNNFALFIGGPDDNTNHQFIIHMISIRTPTQAQFTIQESVVDAANSWSTTWDGWVGTDGIILDRVPVECAAGKILRLISDPAVEGDANIWYSEERIRGTF